MNFKKFLTYLIMIPLGLVAAVNYEMFVFPNAFAPAGVDGVCTMIQHLTNTNMGFLALLVNVPLLIAAWFIVSREFVAKTTIFILTFSFATILFDYVQIPIYQTSTGTSIVLAPIVAGVIRGILYVLTIKFVGSSGGVDVIAEIVRAYKPHFSFMNIIFAINTGIAIAAFFVYGYSFEPVICSIIYSFVTSTVTKSIHRKKALRTRFDIITSESEKLCREITENLHASATVVDARGAYSGSEKKLVITVLSNENVPKLEDLLKNYPDAIAFESMTEHSLKRIG